MGVPGCPELARWTASMDSVRIVFTHSSSSARWSVCTVKAAPLDRESGLGRYRRPARPAVPVRVSLTAPSPVVAFACPALTSPIVCDISLYIAEHNDRKRQAMHGGHAARGPWDGRACGGRARREGWRAAARQAGFDPDAGRAAVRDAAREAGVDPRAFKAAV